MIRVRYMAAESIELSISQAVEVLRAHVVPDVNITIIEPDIWHLNGRYYCL